MRKHIKTTHIVYLLCIFSVLFLFGCTVSSNKKGYAEFTFEGKKIHIENLDFLSGQQEDNWHCMIASPPHTKQLKDFDLNTPVIPVFVIHFNASIDTVQTLSDLIGRQFPVKVVSIEFEEGQIKTRGLYAKEVSKVPQKLQIEITNVDLRINKIYGQFTGTAPFSSRDFLEGRVVEITDGIFEATISKERLWGTKKSLGK